MPELASHPDLADLDEGYPRAGDYAVRFVRKRQPPQKIEQVADMPESMLVIVGDEAGADKALSNLLHVVTQPKSLYSHWIMKSGR